MNEKVKQRNKFGTALVEYIKRNRTDRKGKIHKRREGVLFANSFKDNIVIGFSLTHRTLDEFNKVKGKKMEDLGITIATTRAYKWAEKSYGVIMREDFPTVNDPLIVNIPPSIVPNLERFIERAKKYYKGKQLPNWAKNIQQ